MFTTRILEFMSSTEEAYRSLSDRPDGLRFEISLILADSDHAKSMVRMRMSDGDKRAQVSIATWLIESSIVPADRMAKLEADRLARSLREGV